MKQKKIEGKSKSFSNYLTNAEFSFPFAKSPQCNVIVSFSQASHLESHMEVHTGHQPSTCYNDIRCLWEIQHIHKQKIKNLAINLVKIAIQKNSVNLEPEFSNTSAD